MSWANPDEGAYCPSPQDILRITAELKAERLRLKRLNKKVGKMPHKKHGGSDPRAPGIRQLFSNPTSRIGTLRYN